MSADVRIPFEFVVKKVTWHPPGKALPDEPRSPVLLTSDGQSLPIRMDLHPDPAVLDALTERGRREYDEEKATEAREARKAEAAKWGPMPASAKASRLTASLYGHMRRLRTTPADAASSSFTIV